MMEDWAGCHDLLREGHTEVASAYLTIHIEDGSTIAEDENAGDAVIASFADRIRGFHGVPSSSA